MPIIILPESLLVLAALVVLGLGVGAPDSRGWIAGVAAIGVGVAAASLFCFPIDGKIFHGMLVSAPVARFVQAVVLLLGIACVGFGFDTFPRRHFAEAMALVLFALVGMLLLAGTENLLMIFLGLELASIPLYALAALAKESRASAEAGMKYFLVGGVSAAFLLYGMSLIYGVAGSADLPAIARAPSDPLLTAGIVFMLAGFAFKVAALPFHLWAPDVYEGAPTAAAALIASCSKVAGVFILAKLLAVGFAHWAGSAGWGGFLPGWAPVLALMAGGSILLGNLAALAQSNVKRLLAYSAIAHGGYLLLGLASSRQEVFSAVLFYAVGYALTTAGAFGVVAIVERERGGSRLEDFDGLAKSSPALALCLLVFLISLAGIPPFAGFFGKFYLFSAALGNPSLLWLVVVAIAMNAVSLYYYLAVLKRAFVAALAPGIVTRASGLSRGFVVALAVAVLVIGLAPEILLRPLRAESAAESATSVVHRREGAIARALLPAPSEQY